MAKNVILILEYSVGDFSGMEEDGEEIPTDPNDWRDTFIQSDVDLSAMKVVGVRVEDGESENELKG
jgi:hypothetical protein